jgi:soluble lytic murein transglycosylase
MTWARVGIFVALATALPGLTATLSGDGTTQSTHSLALTPDTESLPEADLPAVLNDGDLAHYRLIFRWQSTAQWAAADHEIAQLEDKLLLGTVEAQRLLHPAYHPSFREVTHWLAHHGDEPDARAIYAAAVKHQPSPDTPLPPAPTVAFLVPRGLGEGLPEAETFEQWDAGLAAWRAGRLTEARSNFEALARGRAPSPVTAAAAFWSARVAMRSSRPAAATFWLRIAAEHPRNFYGVLARHILHIENSHDEDGAPFTEVDAQLVMETAGGRRALALIAIDQTTRAEAELRALAPHVSPLAMEALVALSDRANMPALSLQLAEDLSDGADRRRHGLFPVPRWTPLGGFTVDRALLFALMRQESQFSPVAESPVGAFGVMQLMPATAHAMAVRAGVPLSAHDQQQMHQALADPELNMALAQEYITELMENDTIGDNLMLLAAAYNIGPVPPQRWQSDQQLREDPLLFLESIPVRETRLFTQRVLTNYWIYRQRLQQPTPDLDALAAGEWPTYTALDYEDEPERHAENR